MKNLFKIGFFVMALIFSGKLTAQENAATNNHLPLYYDAELFQWNFSMFGGLTLNFKNQSSRTTYGIQDSMKKALSQYEDTNQQYRSYRAKNIAGNVLVWSGIAAIIGGANVLAFNDRHGRASYENILNKTGIGVMAGGLLIELIGAFILQSKQENIFNAVNLYNRHKISEYK